ADARPLPRRPAARRALERVDEREPARERVAARVLARVVAPAERPARDVVLRLLLRRERDGRRFHSEGGTVGRGWMPRQRGARRDEREARVGGERAQQRPEPLPLAGRTAAVAERRLAGAVVEDLDVVAVEAEHPRLD